MLKHNEVYKNACDTIDSLEESQKTAFNIDKIPLNDNNQQTEEDNEIEFIIEWDDSNGEHSMTQQGDENELIAAMNRHIAWREKTLNNHILTKAMRRWNDVILEKHREEKQHEN